MSNLCVSGQRRRCEIHVMGSPMISVSLLPPYLTLQSPLPCSLFDNFITPLFEFFRLIVHPLIAECMFVRANRPIANLFREDPRYIENIGLGYLG